LDVLKAADEELEARTRAPAKRISVSALSGRIAQHYGIDTDDLRNASKSRTLGSVLFGDPQVGSDGCRACRRTQHQPVGGEQVSGSGSKSGTRRRPKRDSELKSGCHGRPGDGSDVPEMALLRSCSFQNNNVSEKTRITDPIIHCILAGPHSAIVLPGQPRTRQNKTFLQLRDSCSRSCLQHQPCPRGATG